jgi:hypothetical protein
MPIKLLQREISKPIENNRPKRNSFYTRSIILTPEEKKYLQALFNFIPGKQKKKEQGS